jgi:hypothetical protein
VKYVKITRVDPAFLQDGQPWYFRAAKQGGSADCSSFGEAGKDHAFIALADKSQAAGQCVQLSAVGDGATEFDLSTTM